MGSFRSERLPISHVTRPVYGCAISARATSISPASRRSPSSTLFNGQFTYKANATSRIALDIFNIFNVDVPDVTYYYGSWLPQDAADPGYANDPAVNPLLGGAVSSIGGQGRHPGSTGNGVSNLSTNGGGVPDYHFHPAARRVVRLTFSTPL